MRSSTIVNMLHDTCRHVCVCVCTRKCLLFQHSTEINSFGYILFEQQEKIDWSFSIPIWNCIRISIDDRSHFSSIFIHVPMMLLFLLLLLFSLCCWRFKCVALILSSEFIIYRLVVFFLYLLYRLNCWSVCVFLSVGLLVNCTPAAAAAWNLHWAISLFDSHRGNYLCIQSCHSAPNMNVWSNT